MELIKKKKPFALICCVLPIVCSVHVDVTVFRLELTEFPKIDPSDDEGEEETNNNDDDERLSNSISSVSMDGLSLNNPTTTSTSGTSSLQPTSDYESFADCLRQPSLIAPAQLAKSLTNVSIDNHFNIQPSVRVNGEGSSAASEQQRRRRFGTSTTTAIIHANGKTTRVTTNNETPLLSHLFGTQRSTSDSAS